GCSGFSFLPIVVNYMFLWLLYVLMLLRVENHVQEQQDRDKIIFDLNRAPDSPHLHTISLNQFHCFHCKDVLRDGEACKRCTYAKCGSGLGKGLCYICGHNRNSLYDSPSISKTSSRSPPNIDHCCYECGDPLDGIFCKRCTCKSCRKDAHIGYNFPSNVLVISNPKPCNNQTFDELPQTLPIFHPTFHSEDKSPFTLDSTPTYVDESPNVFNPPPQSLVYPCEICDDNIISRLPLFFAIIPNEPVLSTEEPDNSLNMGDEHLDTIPATESDELIKSSVQNLVPIPSESEGTPDTMCDVYLVTNPTPLEAKDHFEIAIKSNDDYSSSDDASLYNENIEYVEASPHDFELVSLEVVEIVIPEDEEIEDDNLREKLLKCPPTDRSDFTQKEFADELTHIISSPKYDCFYFRDLPDPGEWISSLNFGTHENLYSTTCVNLPVEDDHSPLLAYVVWIFLAYLTYLVIPPHLHSFRNEDTIFDPGVTINRFYSFKPGLSHRCGTVKKFNTHCSHLNECPMMINGKNTPTLDVPFFHFYPP
nr:hypothetical protein [Tanacetum cinerariifolium]